MVDCTKCPIEAECKNMLKKFATPIMTKFKAGAGIAPGSKDDVSCPLAFAVAGQIASIKAVMESNEL